MARAHLKLVSSAAKGGASPDGRGPSDELSDAELVAAAQAGDMRAKELIFRRHAPPILHLSTRLLRSRTEAEDVLQETFERALTRLASLRKPEALYGWLMQIAVRRVQRRFRRRRLLNRLGMGSRVERGDATPLDAVASRGSSPEVRLELALLDRVLSRLPDDQRTAWMLRHVEGLTLPEVAGACGVSLATVKRRISAAHAVVRQHVEIPPLRVEPVPEEGGDDVG